MTSRVEQEAHKIEKMYADTQTADSSSRDAAISAFRKEVDEQSRNPEFFRKVADAMQDDSDAGKCPVGYAKIGRDAADNVTSIEFSPSVGERLYGYHSVQKTIEDPTISKIVDLVGGARTGDLVTLLADYKGSYAELAEKLNKAFEGTGVTAKMEGGELKLSDGTNSFTIEKLADEYHVVPGHEGDGLVGLQARLAQVKAQREQRAQNHADEPLPSMEELNRDFKRVMGNHRR